MNNLDVRQMLADIAAYIDTDKHGGIRAFVLGELVRVKILDCMPESALDPFRPLPEAWTALQVGFFDNGEPPKVRNRYITGKDGKRRLKLNRTKMRFGANIKVWTRETINFGQSGQVAWEANFHLWTGEEARSIALDLFEQKYIDRTTMEKLVELTEALSDPSCRFSIPLKKTAEGTRWMREHFIVTVLGDDGLPDRVGIQTPTMVYNTSDPFATELPNGSAFRKNVILQARVGRDETYAGWATEIAGAARLRDAA